MSLAAITALRLSGSTPLLWTSGIAHMQSIARRALTRGGRIGRGAEDHDVTMLQTIVPGVKRGTKRQKTETSNGQPFDDILRPYRLLKNKVGAK